MDGSIEIETDSGLMQFKDFATLRPAVDAKTAAAAVDERGCV